MNKYQKLIKLIEDNNLEIHSQECYDAMSGWTGCQYWIVDTENSKRIFDLSINGYCFEDGSVFKAIDEIEKYLSLKNMNSFDDFKVWVRSNRKKEK